MDLQLLRSEIDTIVVVMLENRSFDHLLGFLSHEDFGARAEVDGLHRNGPDFDWRNPDENGRTYRPEAVADGWLSEDPPHGRRLVGVQMGASRSMDGFVRAHLERFPHDQSQVPAPMRFMRPQDVPVTAALAERYCVCDRWFSALPADTQTNRNMAISGYTLIDSTGDVKPPLKWLPDQTTILDWLKQKALPFEIYVDAPYIFGVGRPSNFVLMRSQWPHLNNAFGLDELGARWRREGKAPAFVYCEPYYDTIAKRLGGHGTCNHPPLPMSFGEGFLSRVYRALTSNPERWKRTVMIVCYDEHGGFFDHVPPPKLEYAAPPHAVWESNLPFQTLGVRVPGLVISPYAAERSVCKEVLDHTSILQLVVERFGEEPDLAFFGAAPQRKRNGIRSALAALTLDEARDDISDLPTPALRLGNGDRARAERPTSHDEDLFGRAIESKGAVATAGE